MFKRAIKVRCIDIQVQGRAAAVCCIIMSDIYCSLRRVDLTFLNDTDSIFIDGISFHSQEYFYQYSGCVSREEYVSLC